ncbi:E3 ubiquitin-protein ligase TRIM69-like [Triplophysa rosa]|uniref:E3 ubiquitin-protein ligase TRIM69-like n=1 Tax=Triplophysa rosa TaxID=992332 RepID=UPI002545F618|nr:E3 ubiquitin-protein ligase TRIM69-like [Triplophysa rosa]
MCSICLDVFSDPVSTPCGHNFCKICLSTYWNNSQDCRCPNCKETFKQRPDLNIYTTLREVVDEHKKKCPEEQAEVVCDICSEGKLKAVKSCLVCQSSYCETHLEPHLRVSGLHEHMKGWRLLKWMQQYAVDVTLDPDTAHPELILSDDEKQVRHGDIRHKLPDNPKRFDTCVNVLGKEGFSSGRFYYEVQVKGKTQWTLGVVRESVDRKGEIALTPVKGFWTVWLRNKNEYKACADPPVSLSLRVKPQKVGVFVDYEEGLVSFYDVDNRSHIYSYTDQSFTEKL